MMAGMKIKWREAHDGSPAAYGYTLDDRLVAQVAYYDTVAAGPAGWVGYARGERVTGRCTSMAFAQQLVEQRIDAPMPVAA